MNNSEDFPVLATYEDAVKHHDSRTPYKRGKNKGLRPLGFMRRYDRSQIRMEGVEGVGNVVVCRLYNTDVIRFLPDNTIIIDHGNYESPSTLECMNRILYQRFGLGSIWGDRFRHQQPVCKVQGKFYLQDIKDPNLKHRFDKPITVTPDNLICGGGVEYKHVLNQQLMGQLRKFYAESGFLEYLRYYVQINPRITKSDYDSGLNEPRPLLVTGAVTTYFVEKELSKRNDFFGSLRVAMRHKKVEDRLAAYLPLVEQLVLSAADYHYDRSIQQYVYIADVKKICTFFYDLGRFQYAEALFTSEMVEQGKMLRDDNSVYLSFGSHWPLPFATV